MADAKQKGEDIPPGIVEQFAEISGVLKTLGGFCEPVGFATARHIRWAYDTVFKRLRSMPQVVQEMGPCSAWLSKVPACSNDKAAPAVLLFHYLSACSMMHAQQIQQPQRDEATKSWIINRGGVVVAISNEDSYQIQRSRHFWTQYGQRLNGLLGVLLREMCGVEEMGPKAAAEKLAEMQAREATAKQPAAAEADTASAPEADASTQAALISMGELTSVDLSKSQPAQPAISDE
jgi:hypothetical protein